MIEIAISLAVIGFALVAIIGILPMGMQTQKSNRQETIINQDASVFLDAIRNGAQGLDDLTNYVVAIVNDYRSYNGLGAPGGGGRNWYTYTNSSIGPSMRLTSGARIIGLLSTPKFIPNPAGGYISNHVVAYVRSLSGPAIEKAPMSLSDTPAQDLAFSLGFSYRMVSDVVPYFGYDTNGLAVGPGAPPSGPGFGRYDARLSENLQANEHDLRLTFLWPLKADGTAGSGYQVFRAGATGLLTWTNEGTGDFSWTNPPVANLPSTLFFFHPRNYLQVHTP